MSTTVTTLVSPNTGVVHILDGDTTLCGTLTRADVADCALAEADPSTATCMICKRRHARAKPATDGATVYRINEASSPYDGLTGAITEALPDQRVRFRLVSSSREIVVSASDLLLEAGSVMLPSGVVVTVPAAPATPRTLRPIPPREPKPKPVTRPTRVKPRRVLVEVPDVPVERLPPPSPIPHPALNRPLPPDVSLPTVATIRERLKAKAGITKEMTYE